MRTILETVRRLLSVEGAEVAAITQSDNVLQQVRISAALPTPVVVDAAQWQQFAEAVKAVEAALNGAEPPVATVAAAVAAAAPPAMVPGAVIDRGPTGRGGFRLTKANAKVLRIMATHPKPWRPMDLNAALGLRGTGASSSNVLSFLLKHGLVSVSGPKGAKNRYYTLTPFGAAVVQQRLGITAAATTALPNSAAEAIVTARHSGGHGYRKLLLSNGMHATIGLKGVAALTKLLANPQRWYRPQELGGGRSISKALWTAAAAGIVDRSTVAAHHKAQYRINAKGIMALEAWNKHIAAPPNPSLLP